MRRTILGVVAIAALVSVTLTACSEAKKPVFDSAPKLIAAAQAFARDHQAGEQPLPPTVSLRELLEGGYLEATEVRAFEGMEVEVSLTAGADNLQQILVSAQLPDGSKIALLGDGSVQQIAAPVHLNDIPR
jgi:hypothetical protein